MKVIEGEAVSKLHHRYVLIVLVMTVLGALSATLVQQAQRQLAFRILEQPEGRFQCDNQRQCILDILHPPIASTA